MRPPPKTIYVVHDGSGGGNLGEPYEDQSAALRVASDLTEQEGAPWYVARYVRVQPPDAPSGGHE